MQTPFRSRALFAGLVILLLAGSSPAEARPIAAARPILMMPSTPAGAQLDWALSEINSGALSLTVDDLTSRFAPDYLAGLPAPQLLSAFQTYFVPNAPMAVARFEGATDRSRIEAVVRTATGDWQLSLGTESAEPYRINELFLTPLAVPTGPAKPVRSWKSLNKRIAKVAPEVSFVAAEVTDGACSPIDSLNPDLTLGVGSSFKLYVLGELARQIEAGTASWDEALTVRSDLRSLPNGDMRLEAPGTTFPIRYFAEQMISQSDNTATDHLIDRLGRENVEAIMRAMGHEEPSENQPLLLTREWFAIKLRLRGQDLASYLGASESRKREILTSEVDGQADTLADDEEWTNPYLIDSVEWFASAGDLCRAMAYLHAASSRSGLEEIQDALSINPGLNFDASLWRYVGYKGGYETGVKSDTWLLERADGRWFVISAIINDPTKEIDGGALWQLVVPAVEMLAVSK